LARRARDLAAEPTATVGIPQHQGAAAGVEELQGAPPEPGDRPSGVSTAWHRREEVEHEAQLALRAALVLAEVADQVPGREEVKRAKEMRAVKGEVFAVRHPARHIDHERIAEREDDGDRHRSGEAPAHAGARDDEGVKQEEGARTAFREDRDHRDPGDVGSRRGVPDPVLTGEPTAYQTEAEEEEHESDA